MAYVYDPSLTDDENKKRELEQQKQDAGGAVLGADTPGGVGQGAPTASGSYTNLQKYLSENESQGQGLAQKFGEKITQEGEAAKKSVDELYNKGTQAVESARVPTSSIIDEATASPAAVQSDAAKKAQLLRERDASYAGPSRLQDLEGYQDAESKVKSAGDRISLADTEAGRMELLRELSGPGAGRGKLALNQLLLTGTPGVGDTLAAAAQPYRGLQDYLSEKSTDIGQRATTAADEAAATSSGVRGKLGEAQTTREADINSRVNTARTNIGNQYNSIVTKLASRQPLSAEDIATLGVADQATVDKIYNDAQALQHDYNTAVDLTGYTTRPGMPEMITKENLATPEDYAAMLALADLSGSQPSFLTESTRGQAGKANLDPIDFDLPAAQSATTQQLTAKDNQSIENFYYSPKNNYEPSAAGEWIDNKNPNFKGYGIIRIINALDGRKSWEETANSLFLSVPELKTGLKALLRQGRLGGPEGMMTPTGFRAYLTPQEKDKINSL